MAHFYFFKNDGQCKWMQKELAEQIPKYLYDPIDFDGKKIKFYLILKWIKNDIRGINLKALNEFGVNYVETLDDLPEGAGIYITGYDADVQELAAAQESKIPIIERPCPWVRQLRTQIIESDCATHQYVIMIDQDHMVYDCYQSLFPEDVILVTPENYQQEIKRSHNGKPLALMVYATFRKKEAEAVGDYINTHFYHQDNQLNGYDKTLCCWTRQGLLEEIDEAVRGENLREIWVICSSEGDRSTISILNEIEEAGAMVRIIKKYEDIPEKVAEDSRIGVLLAPIPLPGKIKDLKNIIRERLGYTYIGGMNFES